MPLHAIAPAVTQLPLLQKRNVIDLALIRAAVQHLPEPDVRPIVDNFPSSDLTLNPLISTETTVHSGDVGAEDAAILPPIVDPMLTHLTSAPALAHFASQMSDKLVEAVSATLFYSDESNTEAALKNSSSVTSCSFSRHERAIVLMSNVAATFYTQRYLTEMTTSSASAAGFERHQSSAPAAAKLLAAAASSSSSSGSSASSVSHATAAGSKSAAATTHALETLILSYASNSTAIDIMSPQEVAERIHRLIEDCYVPLARMIISTAAQLSASYDVAAAAAAASSSSLNNGGGGGGVGGDGASYSSSISVFPESLRTIRNASVLSLGQRATVLLIDAVSPVPSSSSSSSSGPNGKLRRAPTLEIEAAFTKFFKEGWVTHCQSLAAAAAASSQQQQQQHSANTTNTRGSGRGAKASSTAANSNREPSPASKHRQAAAVAATTAINSITPPAADLLSILTNVQAKFQLAERGAASSGWVSSPTTPTAPTNCANPNASTATSASSATGGGQRAEDPTISPAVCEAALRVAMVDWLTASMAPQHHAATAASSASSVSPPPSQQQCQTSRTVCEYLINTALPSTVLAEVLGDLRRRTGAFTQQHGGETFASPRKSANDSFIMPSSLSMGDIAFVSACAKESPTLLRRCATFLMLQHYLNPDDYIPTVVMSAVMSVAEAEQHCQIEKKRAELLAAVGGGAADANDEGANGAVPAKRRRTEKGSDASSLPSAADPQQQKTRAMLLNALSAVPPAVHIASYFPQLHTLNAVASRVTIRSYMHLSGAAAASGNPKASTAAADSATSTSSNASSASSSSSSPKSLCTHALICKALAGPCLSMLLGSDDCERFLLAHGATSPSETARARAAFAATMAAEAARSDSESQWDRVGKYENSEEKADNKDDIHKSGGGGGGSNSRILNYSGPSSHLAKTEAYNKFCTRDFLLRLVNQFEACEGAAIFKEPVYPSTIMNHSGAQLGPYANVIKAPMSIATLRLCINEGAAAVGGFDNFGAGNFGGKSMEQENSGDAENTATTTAKTASSKRPTSPPPKSKAPFPITTLGELRKGLWLIAANCSVFNAPEGPFPEKARVFVNHCCKLVDQAAGMMLTI